MGMRANYGHKDHNGVAKVTYVHWSTCIDLNIARILRATPKEEWQETIAIFFESVCDNGYISCVDANDDCTWKIIGEEGTSRIVDDPMQVIHDELEDGLSVYYSDEAPDTLTFIHQGGVEVVGFDQLAEGWESAYRNK